MLFCGFSQLVRRCWHRRSAFIVIQIWESFGYETRGLRDLNVGLSHWFQTQENYSECACMERHTLQGRNQSCGWLVGVTTCRLSLADLQTVKLWVLASVSFPAAPAVALSKQDLVWGIIQRPVALVSIKLGWLRVKTLQQLEHPGLDHLAAPTTIAFKRRVGCSFFGSSAQNYIIFQHVAIQVLWEDFCNSSWLGLQV